MKLFIIRHAEASGNKQDRLISRTGGRLTSKGIAQAKALSSLLRQKELECVVSSPSARCVDTARFVADHSSLTLKKDSRLRERNLGPYEGMNIAELKAHRISLGHTFLDHTQDWENDENVEQDSSIFKRVTSLITELSDQGVETAALFTHAGVLKSCVSECLNLPRHKSAVLKFPNASTTCLEGPKPFWILRFMSVPIDLATLP